MSTGSSCAMHRKSIGAVLRSSLWFGAAAWLLGGCSLLTAPRPAAAPAVVEAKGPDPKAPRLVPLETRHVELAKGQDLVGETQLIFARHENTFSSIGRQ